MSNKITKRVVYLGGLSASLTIAMALQGCATTASDPQFTHKATPSERVFRLPKIADGAAFAKVRVMRDAQFQGSAMTTTLTINGQEAAAIDNGEEVIFQIEPGEHLIGLKFLGNDPVWGAFTLGFARPKRFIESATHFDAGKEYIFRIVDNANWEWELKRSSY
jgi:hypothetical protein